MIRNAQSVTKAHTAQMLLSSAQTEVLQLAATGQTNEQIARSLFVSVSTVERHFTQIYQRLQVRNRAAAVSWFTTQ